MSDVFLETNKKGLCGRCGKTRGMHHFITYERAEGTETVRVYCTPPKKEDHPVAMSDSVATTSEDPELQALWEPTPDQCSSCGHVSSHGGNYWYKVTEKYRYCLWCSGRGGKGNVMRLILVRALADRDCENPTPKNPIHGNAGEAVVGWEEFEDCGKCLPCLARKWGDHPFA